MTNPVMQSSSRVDRVDQGTSTAPLDPPGYDMRLAVDSNRLRGLWKMATGRRRSFAGVMGLISISAVAKMLTFVLIAYIVDDVFGRGIFGFGVLLPLGLSFVGLAVIEGGFIFLARSRAAMVAERIIRDLRDSLYDHFQNLSFTFHDKNRTGELIQRATSDVDAVRRFYSEQVMEIGRILLPFFINLIAIFALNSTLGWIAALSIPFMLLVSWFFGQRIETTYEHYQKQDEVITTALQENLAGVRVVKAFARQDYEIERFEKENHEKYRRGVKLLMQHAYFWPTADVMAWAQMFLGFIIGGTLTLEGKLTIGTYLAYIGLLNQVVWPMRMLGRMLVNTMQSLVSYTRLAEIFAKQREPLDNGMYQPSGNLIGAVRFQNVSMQYENDKEKTVLNGISFDVEAGQVVALLGSTGSGKTTLINLLPRFYEYTSGSVTLDGVELNQYSRRYLRQQIGLVEQEPFLFSRSIRDNITYGLNRQVTDDEVFAAAKAAAVHDVILSFPKGYDTLVGEKGVTLSGGQKQRVALARTLLKNPRILILDDATSSVDPETEGEIREALTGLMQDRTTFLIAHRIQSVMIADLILVMDKGHIVQMGTHDELMAVEGTYRQVYELQSKIEDELEREISQVAAPDTPLQG